MQVVSHTSIAEYPLVARGKVRDIYEIDADTLLMVATDRMSAFDVIMSSPIPYKGVVLNMITQFWMDKVKHRISNHLKETDVARFPAPLQKYADQLEGRAVLVRKAKPLTVECIVRGYLSGTGWKDYQATGKLSGHTLPEGLLESGKLPEPIFSPSTKAELGSHDQNISEDEAAKLVGEAIYATVRETSLGIFKEGCDYAASRGIIIADTKFEFGLVGDRLTLIDEVMTPDSSRFWPADQYRPGKGQPSFDKQYLRDWLLTQPWNMAPPPPALPEEVIRETSARYLQAYEIITGKTLAV